MIVIPRDDQAVELCPFCECRLAQHDDKGCAMCFCPMTDDEAWRENRREQ